MDKTTRRFHVRHFWLNSMLQASTRRPSMTPSHHVRRCWQSTCATHEFCTRGRSQEIRLRSSVSGHSSSNATPLLPFSTCLSNSAACVLAQLNNARGLPRGWQTVLATLVTATESPDADTLLPHRHSSAPSHCNCKPHTLTTNERPCLPP